LLLIYDSKIVMAGLLPRLAGSRCDHLIIEPETAGTVNADDCGSQL